MLPFSQSLSGKYLRTILPIPSPTTLHLTLMTPSSLSLVRERIDILTYTNLMWANILMMLTSTMYLSSPTILTPETEMVRIASYSHYTTHP